MHSEPSSLQVLKQIDIHNLDAAAPFFAPEVVWHYSNPNLPDLEGDYVGLSGIKDFFQTIGSRSHGTFTVEAQSVMPIGSELIVVHARNTLALNGRQVVLDVAVVWRIADGLVQEVWDIVPGQAA